MVSFIQSIDLRFQLLHEFDVTLHKYVIAALFSSCLLLFLNELLHVLMNKEAVYFSPYLLREFVDIQICFLSCPM